MSGIRRLRAAFTALACLAIVWSPELAAACPVCSAGRDEENRAAFLLTTVFLSALPLAMIGGAVTWLVRRLRAAELEAAAGTSDPARPLPARRP